MKNQYLNTIELTLTSFLVSACNNEDPDMTDLSFTVAVIPDTQNYISYC